LAERLRDAGPNGLVDIDTGERYSSPGRNRLLDVGDFLVHPTDIILTTRSLSQGVYEVVKRGAFSIFLGGDHYVSYPSAVGFTAAQMEKNSRVRIGYVHIDGHLDFAKRDPIMGRYFYGSQARRISEIPCVVPSCMAWIGSTGTASKEQVDTIYRNGGQIFFAKDVVSLGAAEVARRAAEHVIKGSDLIYLTLDIDVIDAGYVPGTGAVDHNMITPLDIKTILLEISKYPLASMDIMEVSPRLDSTGRSTSIAAEIAFAVASTRLQ
jgi:arginase family enzyme